MIMLKSTHKKEIDKYESIISEITEKQRVYEDLSYYVSSSEWIIKDVWVNLKETKQNSNGKEKTTLSYIIFNGSVLETRVKEVTNFVKNNFIEKVCSNNKIGSIVENLSTLRYRTSIVLSGEKNTDIKILKDLVNDFYLQFGLYNNEINNLLKTLGK